MAASGTEAYLAVDIGAESGRAIVGEFDGERVTLREVARFPNQAAQLPTGIYWDAIGLYRQVLTGIQAAFAAGARPVSVGIDTWGVDFGLLDETGDLIGNPLNYRDPRLTAMPERLFQRMSRRELYERTGLQQLPFNTSCQLLALENSPKREIARTFLMMPDLLRYWLTGQANVEITDASTTQLLNATTASWDADIITAVGWDPAIFPELVVAGTPTGPLLPPVASELAASAAEALQVMAVGSHDTASAVAAVPAEAEADDSGQFGYISSGTWSLVGVERTEPLLTPGAMAADLTNERGVAGTIRLLKNVMGLWLLQESRRTWARAGHEYEYRDLVEMARRAPAFGAVIDPDHSSFLTHGDMPRRIAERCGACGETVPDGHAATVRCIFESLALKYRYCFERIAELTGKPIRVIHVVGGGARNDLLCQLTADATGLPVVAGPVEATALGNVLVQALGNGRLGSLADIRAIVRQSVELARYEPTQDPGERARWDEAMSRLEAQLVRDVPAASTS